MKLGENGEAYFVDETDLNEVPDYLATSPLPYDLDERVCSVQMVETLHEHLQPSQLSDERTMTMLERNLSKLSTASKEQKYFTPRSSVTTRQSGDGAVPDQFQMDLVRDDLERFH